MFLASHPQLKVFKLHGSVNWARSVGLPRDRDINAIIEAADTIKPTGPFVQVNRGQEEKDGNLLFPAIAIPVQSKDNSTFACPNTHLDYLKGLLPKVTKILIVGWQAREAHFTGILKSHLTGRARMLVVSGNQEEANKILGYFNAQVGYKASSDSEVPNGGFTDFVVNREGDEFFSS